MQNNAVRVFIKDDAPCPCGSGTAFSLCCKKKNHIYESLAIDKAGKRVLYDQSEIIAGIDSVVNFIEDRINKIDTSLTREEALRKLKKLYQLLNKALNPMQKVTTCSAGCGYCCRLLIYTSPLEIELMKEYIKDNFSAEMIFSFTSKVSKHNSLLLKISVEGQGKFTEESKNLFYENEVPCAFLDDDKRCTIYEARPFICRKYLVYNDPEVCSDPRNKTNQYHGGYLTTVKDAIYKLNTLVYGSSIEGNHLLSWFAKK